MATTLILVICNYSLKVFEIECGPLRYILTLTLLLPSLCVIIAELFMI